MYSVTGQTENQQVSQQHCPPCVLIFVIGQPIINVKDSHAFRPITILPQTALRRDCKGKCIEWIEGHYLEVVVEVYLMKHNGVILYHLYLHVGEYRLLRKQ